HTLARRHIPDLRGPGTGLAQDPPARRMVVAVELKDLDIVLSTHPSSNGEALAGLYIDQHHLVGLGGSGGYEQPDCKQADQNKSTVSRNTIHECLSFGV